MPTIADIIIAIVYFMAAFDVYFGLIVLATMVLYLSKLLIIFCRMTSHDDNI